MPEVSIITPCYNSSDFLRATAASVLGQTFTDWEWLITDDCSSDHSAAILKSYHDPRIHVTVAPKNGGAGQARNMALEKAAGRYITFLDADDCWEPEFLEKMISFMKKNHAELAYSGYARCDEQLVPAIADFVADREVTFKNILKTCRLSLLSSMYDSKRVGKEFFPSGTKREDHVMWLHLLQKIPKGLPLPETLAKYRMRATSVSRKKSDLILDQYRVYHRYMKFGVLKSLYYTIHWAVNGFFKYSRIFN